MIRKLVAKGIYRPEVDALAVTWILCGDVILLSLVIGTSMPMRPIPLGGSIGSLSTEVWIENIVCMSRKDLLANVTKS